MDRQPTALSLVEAEIPRMRRFARLLARDPDIADDLVQEALTRAVAKIESWTPGTNMRAWLFAIVRNVHLNEMRRTRTAEGNGRIDVENADLTMAGNQEARIALGELASAFTRLSDEHREILLLVGAEGLQYEEAAIVLDLPVGTVRSRLSRARRSLRRELGERAEAGSPERRDG